MSGKIIYRKPQPHHCEPGLGAKVSVNTGDVWKCDDCGKTYVFKNLPNSDYGGYRWNRESKRARRKRERPGSRNLGWLFP
jgi:ribosomal protein L37AE/L43A